MLKKIFILSLALTTIFHFTYAEGDIEKANEVKLINIAQPQWGAKAFASSQLKGYGPENVLKGKWPSRMVKMSEDIWVSAPEKKKQWLAIDLGAEYEIARVVIYHIGAAGVDFKEQNTSDYRLQAAESQSGPWKDIAISFNNIQDVTTHEIPLVRARFVRMMISKAGQKDKDSARIYAFEVYTRADSLKAPLLDIDFTKRKYRDNNGQVEAQVSVKYYLPPGANGLQDRLILKYEGREIGFNDGGVNLWLPVDKKPEKMALVEKSAAGTLELASLEPDTPSSPGYFFKGGTIHIISSSHQDIAWMDTPQFCRKWRGDNVVTPAIEMFNKIEDYRFTVETMMYLMDEMEDHPERKDEIHRLTREGRLEWGATYNQPYEGLESGEQLIRNMYLGRKWLHKTFPDCDAVVAWSPDVPGRTMQMPQILSKSGIEYLVFSRHSPGIFKWFSPDGSSITAYSSGIYADGQKVLSAPPEEGVERLSKLLDRDEEYFLKHKLPPQYPILNTNDFEKPRDFSDFISLADSSGEAASGNGESSAGYGMKVRYSSAREFFEAVEKGSPDFASITGERPDVWLYIHGPTHHYAISAKREAGVLLPAAEMFSTINSLLSEDFNNYPASELFEAWKAAIFPDHGWGGFNGEVTDAVFRDKLEFARDKGSEILNRSLKSITRYIKTDAGKGMPVVVFNALSWNRGGPVTVRVENADNLQVVDSGGKTVPHQVVPGSGNGVSILFIANDVPSIGYKTYYLAKRKTKESPIVTVRAESGYYENKYYKISLASGGLSSIYDKEIGREIIQPGKFRGGEIFTMKSEGNGAGEFAMVQQPTMDCFDQMSAHNPSWEFSKSESGPVRTVYTMNQKTEHVTISQKLIIYNDIKRIDIEVSLLGWDGTKYREFRMALPVNMTQGAIAYETPMGVVEVGKDEIAGAAGERYTQKSSEVHPREVQNFFSANNSDFGVTVSSSVAVFDWIDPTGASSDYPLLQPILLASRKSCHALGNWYLQEGDHYYTFSILSHKAGWENGYRFGIEANNPLLAVRSRAGRHAYLPAEKSFFSVSTDNVLISAVKKAEDDDAVVVRLYDIEGKDSTPELKTFFKIKNAEHTNLIEEEGRRVDSFSNALKVTIGHHAIETFRLYPVEE